MTIPIRYSKPEKVQTKTKEAKLANMDVSYIFFINKITIFKAIFLWNYHNHSRFHGDEQNFLTGF